MTAAAMDLGAAATALAKAEIEGLKAVKDLLDKLDADLNTEADKVGAIPLAMSNTRRVIADIRKGLEYKRTGELPQLILAAG